MKTSDTRSLELRLLGLPGFNTSIFWQNIKLIQNKFLIRNKTIIDMGIIIEVRATCKNKSNVYYELIKDCISMTRNYLEN